MGFYGFFWERHETKSPAELFRLRAAKYALDE